MRIALLTLLVAVACGDKDDDTGTDDAGTDDSGSDEVEGDLAGKTVYDSNCAGCHGSDGTGLDGRPSLVDAVPNYTNEALLDIMDVGTGGMPAIGVTGTDADDLLEYLRAEFGS